jgi:hypothetical protein
LKTVFQISLGADVAIRTIDLRGSFGIAACPVRMMLFDELLYACSVAVESAPGSRRSAHMRKHRQACGAGLVHSRSNVESGASDGARTRDLRRDRPAL